MPNTPESINVQHTPFTNAMPLTRAMVGALSYGKTARPDKTCGTETLLHSY